jgi:type VI protein secretion system component VasK
MSAPPIMLADDEMQEILGSWRLTDPGTIQGLIIFGAIGLVTLLILVWAIFFRKQRRRRSHHHSHHHSSEPAVAPEVPAAEPGPLPPETHHQRKRLRRRRRSRNPTLAETGGLPPIRPELPPETPT